MKFVNIVCSILEKRTSIATLVVFISLLLPVTVRAFYEQQNASGSIDARGLVRGFANVSKYPADKTLYPDQNTSGFAGVARIMIDGDIYAHWGFEINAYQTYIPSALLTNQSSAGLPSSVERSALLDTSFSKSDHAHLAIDRFALRWTKKDIDITLGRQTINLATTFYFTPNDFFAPFSAQTFYRVYKPGVDALRAEISVGELSQLSLISVLGYRKDAMSDTGWSNRPDGKRNSYVASWSNATDQMDTTFILGHVVDKNIIGFALQGEFFEWLSVRLEGHYGKSQQVSLNDYQQVSLGLGHRWESSLEFQWEFFYNGLGSDNIAGYRAVAEAGRVQYFARRYSALGGRYDITPLLNGQVLMISNLDDNSHLLSLNTRYSLSDESEWVVNFNFPLGSEPNNVILESEFGAYPMAINVEIRGYF